MSFLTLETSLRVVLFGGSFLFTLAIIAFIYRDGQGRWTEVLPWLALGATASALTLPALGFSLLGLGVRFQDWVTPLGCLALSGVPLALLTVGLYATLTRSQTTEETPINDTVVHEIRATGPRPYFQAVCRNPTCRAPMESGERRCATCGWDQERPVPSRGMLPAAKPAPHHNLPGLAESALAYLVIRSGPQAGTSFRLARNTDIGSDPGNQVNLQDPFVSREHATIRYKSTSYVYYDMSSNGSYLITPDAKKRLDVPHTLRHGDMIELGDTLLVFMQAG
jgi:hypothetical protein